MSYELNTSQQIAFNRFLDFVKYTDSYEVKSLNIRDSYGDAYIDVEIGVKNDDGTMAEIFCRNYYLFFIGKRGGIYQFNSKYSKVYRKYYEVEALDI